MSYVHSLDPFAIEFYDGFGIRWYGLAYIAGFALAFYSMHYMARRGKAEIDPRQIETLMGYLIFGVMGGGRLGYCIFYAPELFLKWSASFPFWGVLEVHKGGMASHGGLAGLIIACLLFARKYKLQGVHLVDLCVFGGGFGITLGRIANFINGELYGREAPSHISWGVKFPQEIFHWGADQLDKLKTLATSVESLAPINLSNGQKIDATSDQWMAWVNDGSQRAFYYIDSYKEALVHAVQSGNQTVLENMEAVLTYRYPSQLIQSFLEGFVVVAILFFVWRWPQKPGVISALYGCLYAVARIIGEQYRLPDAHIGYELFGLTRGQWLSVAMFGACVLYLVFSLRRPTEKLGGWGKSHD